MSDMDEFKRALRAWILEDPPTELFGTRGAGKFDGYWGGRRRVGAGSASLRWLERMAARGLTAPTWPVAYGGAGLSPDHARAIDEVLADLALPPPLVGFGLVMLGPIVLAHGTEAQKLRVLPDIAAGRVRWCQGYSEPNAGSDLASLRTRAVRDGDHYRVTGQKIWTSHADDSDALFCLVRTDPDASKHKGISFVLIELDQPGVTIRPIPLISGASPFCEVFLEDVPVPVADRIGAEHAGWGVAMSLLQHERSMIGAAMSGQIAGAEAQLVARARAAGPIGGALRVALSSFATDAAAFEAAVDDMMREGEQRGTPGDLASVLKVVGSGLKQRRWELAMQAMGVDGLGWEGEAFAEADRVAAREWLRSRGNTIEGGTTEIQHDVIARRVLGLPDRPAREGHVAALAGALAPEVAEIASAVAAVLADDQPIARVRAARSGVDRGWSDARLATLDACGYVGAHLPESVGGSGLSLLAAAAVSHEVGRRLVPEPVTADTIGRELGGAAGRTAWMCAEHGGVVVIEPHDGRVTGHVAPVIAAMGADRFVIRTSTGWIEVEARHATVTPLCRLDGLSAGRVTFDAAPFRAVVVDDGVMARASLLFAAELLGVAEGAFERTCVWLGERQQFGVAIGTFQVLQHRAASWLCRLLVARSAVAAAARAWDLGDGSAARLASMAKATVGETAAGVVRDAIQMHGGIGMTDEHDIGLFFKRAHVLEHTAGDASFHRDRWATLGGW